MYELLLTRRAKQFYEKADSVLVRKINPIASVKIFDAIYRLIELCLHNMLRVLNL